jgi:hypothetical protein
MKKEKRKLINDTAMSTALLALQLNKFMTYCESQANTMKFGKKFCVRGTFHCPCSNAIIKNIVK